MHPASYFCFIDCYVTQVEEVTSPTSVLVEEAGVDVAAWWKEAAGSPLGSVMEAVSGN